MNNGDQIDIPEDIEINNINASSDPSISTLRGFFALIHHSQDRIFLATDRIRSIPLYYAITSDRIIISDSSDIIFDQLSTDSMDTIAKAQYLLTGYVWGNRTLFPSIQQLLPGQILILDLDQSASICETSQYYRFPSNDKIGDSDAIIQEFKNALRTAFDRLSTFADGRPIVVALSGGYDSRLCLLMLREVGYENVQAVTFGDPDSENAKKARNAAIELDIEWKMIPSTHDEWNNWYRTDDRVAFDRAIGTVDGIPNIDHAVELKKASSHQLLPDDAIIVPGDSVCTTGEHIPPAFLNSDTINQQRLYQQLLQLHHRWDSRLSIPDEIQSKLQSRMMNSFIDGPESSLPPIAAAERWDWHERQPKFITETAKFEYYSFDWWLPLWDPVLMECWSSLPINARYKKQILIDVAVELHASYAGVSQTAAKQSFIGDSSPGLYQQLLNRIRETVDEVPVVEPVSNYIFFKYFKPLPRYESDPQLGVLNEDLFNNLKISDEYVHGYRILDRLGYISIDDSHISEWPDIISISRWDK